MKFPLFEVNENKLVSLSGETSFLFRLFPPDLEQVENKETCFRSLERALVQTDSEWLKLYCIDGGFWLNSKEQPEFSMANATPENDPLSMFFSGLDSDIEFYDDYYVYNGVYHRLLSLKEFFPQIEAFDLEGVNLCLNLRRLPTGEAKKRLNLKRKLHYSALFKGIRDIESENAYAEADGLLENVVRGDEALFETESFFSIKASTKEELDLNTGALVDYVKTLSGKAFIEARGLQYFFYSLIPGVRPSFKRAQLCPSKYLSELVPFNQDKLMETGMRLASRSKNSVYFDLFGPTCVNYNVLITGVSGQGKSMLANKLIMEHLGGGGAGVVLDLGNSFRKNVMFHGGSVFSEKINPLQFTDPVYLKEFVKAILGQTLSRKEEGKLFEVISSLDLASLCVNELIAELESEFTDIRFYFSEFKAFFTDEVIDLNKLSYCDLTNYPESFKPALMVYLIEYFKHLEGHKIFVFDECWGLLKNNADYIAECFRTFRKHNASAVAISQNMDDFSKTQLGRVIIQNTYFKFLFAQNLSDSHYLSSYQKELLSSVSSMRGKYSEFLFVSDEHQKVCRFYSSPLEYELFHSSKEESFYFDQYMEDKGKYLPFRDAVINFTKIKNPGWEI